MRNGAGHFVLVFGDDRLAPRESLAATHSRNYARLRRAVNIFRQREEYRESTVAWWGVVSSGKDTTPTISMSKKTQKFIRLSELHQVPVRVNLYTSSRRLPNNS